MSSEKGEDVHDWVLLAKLKQLVSSASQSPSGKVDGGKESSGALGGNSSSSQPQQAPAPSVGKAADVGGLSTETSLSSLPIPSSSAVSVGTRNPLLGSGTDDETNLFRQRLAEHLTASTIDARLGGFNLLKRKHFYFAVDGDCGYADSTAGDANDILRIKSGDDYDNRLGTSVRIHRITKRVWHSRSVTKNSTVSVLRPTIRHEMLWVDKIPLDQTKCPALYEAGSIPPDGDSKRPSPPFNCLGVDPSTTNQGHAVDVAVRNPMSKPLYEIIDHSKIDYSPTTFTQLTLLATDGRGALNPYALTYEKTYKLDMIVIYPDLSVGNPIINNLWYNCYIDRATIDGRAGWNEEFFATFDIEFSDESL